MTGYRRLWLWTLFTKKDDGQAKRWGEIRHSPSKNKVHSLTWIRQYITCSPWGHNTSEWCQLTRSIFIIRPTPFMANSSDLSEFLDNTHCKHLELIKHRMISSDSYLKDNAFWKLGKWRFGIYISAINKGYFLTARHRQNSNILYTLPRIKCSAVRQR